MRRLRPPPLTPRLAAPQLRGPPPGAPGYDKIAEGLKPLLPRSIPLDEFYKWLKGRRRVVFLFGPPGTGKTYYGTQLVARGRVKLPNDVEVALHDGQAPPAAGYFTAAMARDAERRWRKEFGGVCDGQVATIHSFAVRSLGFGLKIFPPAYKTSEGYSIYGGGGAAADPAVAQELYRAEASQRAGLKYSMDPYRPAAGNYLFQIFDYALHVGGIPALREAWLRLDRRGRSAWVGYLKLLRWPQQLVFTALTDRRVDSLCEAAGGAHKLYLLLHGGLKLDFTLAVEAARCLRQQYDIRCGGGRIRPRALLLDEFQDLSPALMSLTARIFDSVEYVVLAGDDDQTVYDGLHGASPDAAVEVAEMIQAGEVPGEYHVLSRSFRVPEGLAQKARRVVEPIPRRVRKVWRGRDADGEIERIPCREVVNHVAREVGSGKRVFVLAVENSTVLTMMLALQSRGMVAAGLKGLPANMRRLYEKIVDHLTAQALDRSAAERQVPPDVAAFLEKIRGREGEVARLLKALLDGGRGLAEKLPLFVDTVHASKGLEADVVFVVNAALNAGLQADQRRRLTYVALTRARERVYIVEGCGGWRWVVEV